MSKFPQRVFVTEEKEQNCDPYLLVHEGGEDDLDFNQTTTVAIYKLERTGKVVVQRRFAEAPK